MGATVPINFRGCQTLTCACLFSHFTQQLAFLGEGGAFFCAVEKPGFKLFLWILWRIQCDIIIHWMFVLYCVNFEVLNNGFNQIISCYKLASFMQWNLLEYITVYIFVQGSVSFFILLFSKVQQFLSFCVDVVLLVVLCPHLDSFLYCSVGEGLPIPHLADLLFCGCPMCRLIILQMIYIQFIVHSCAGCFTLLQVTHH